LLIAYTENICNVTLGDSAVIQWPAVGQFDTLLPLYTLAVSHTMLPAPLTL
jgi:hypothetical protein